MHDLDSFFNNNFPNTGMRSIDQFELMLKDAYETATQVEEDFVYPVLFYHQDNILVAYYDLECHTGFLLQRD